MLLCGHFEVHNEDHLHTIQVSSTFRTMFSYLDGIFDKCNENYTKGTLHNTASCVWQCCISRQLIQQVCCLSEFQCAACDESYGLAQNPKHTNTQKRNNTRTPASTNTDWKEQAHQRPHML